MPKTTREKLATKTKREVKETSEGLLLIPSAPDVEEQMRRPKNGQLITTGIIREALTKKHGAKRACPLVTGIFSKMVAQAAEEDRADGIEDIVPWWRTLKPDGSLNEKYPDGPDYQADLLTEEGFEIERGKGRSKKLRVVDFEKFLVK
ncbi:MAG TPA: MGMT family protein [Caldisericia bacterium]|nr:MGMT family protein [Caldisericia bacterium]HPF48514.1 MGMT family protein [Caldisericia bacterium]HPI83305.1 MGMT family protein [Caldisericia bacterium]HPQ92969.1 MGMT family protein [Caldisericia bacterium]HRV75197.1 MGMT family protein [Caldisericia bacterium]